MDKRVAQERTGEPQGPAIEAADALVRGFIVGDRFVLRDILVVTGTERAARTIDAFLRCRLP